MAKANSAVRFLIPVLILIFCFACCDSSGGIASGTVKQEDSAVESAAAPEDRLELSIALWNLQDALSKNEKDQFYEHLSEKFNITIESVPITWDDYMEKIQIWAASNQLPDVFSADAIGTQYYRNWIGRGLLKALPEDLSDYPRLSSYLDMHDADAMKSEGRLYCIPRGLYDSIRYCAHDRNVFYRWDLAREAGINKEPETWEEFEAMLWAVIDRDPENKGIKGLTIVNLRHLGGLLWLYSNPAATSDGSGNDFKWIREDGRYIPAVFSKNALPSLLHARKMYSDGLIDEEITMMKGSQAYDKFSSGKAAAILVVGYGNLDTMVKPGWKSFYPDKNLMDCVKRTNYFPSTDGVRYQSTFKTYWSESYFSSQIGEDKLERLLALYDYLLTEKAKGFYRFGVEDVDYRRDGDELVLMTRPEDLAKKQKSASVISSLVEFDNKFQYDKDNYIIDPDIRKAAVEDLETVIKTTRIPEYEPGLTYLSTPAKDRFSISDNEDILKIMLSEEPVEKLWEEILADYEAKGLSRMIGEVNDRAKEMGID